MNELSTQLASYLAIDRLHSIASGRPLATEAHGCALFADISGFTTLTESLERELGARQGGEALTSRLNAVYRGLVDEVHRAGGTVIGFSGDAMSCFFDADDGIAATSCGIALQRASQATQLPLGLKVGVARGPVSRFSVGDPTLQRLDVLSGAPVERAAAAESNAAPGQVVVERAIADDLRGRASFGWETEALTSVVSVRDAREDRPWPAITTDCLSPDVLRSWLLAPVYERVASGHGDFLAELRRATSLFVRFGGIDFAADEDAGPKLDAYVHWVQHVVDQLGGSLLQLTTGDKGAYFYASFGVPVAQEDATARALSAALRLRVPPPALDFVTSTQIGIGRGLVRSGAYGSEHRRTYGALGDEANVAARLMARAHPSQVLVSDRLAADAPASFRFAPLGVTALKGRDAMPIHALVGESMQRPSARMRSATCSSSDAVIGRISERAELRRRLETFHQDGASALVLVEGEAGLGKSRLAADLVAQATAMGVRTLVAMAESVEQNTSYFAWRSVFAALFGVDTLDTAERIQERIVQALSPELRPFAPLLSSVLEARIPATAETAALVPAERAKRVPAYLERVFRHLATAAPVALVVEDAHWLDSASHALLERVVVRPCTFTFVTSRVPAPRIGLEGVCHVLRLEPMNATDTAALVGQLLGASRVDDAVGTLVFEKSEGNPFFAEQLTLSLRDLGVLRVDGERVTLQIGRDLVGLPATIEGVVTSRIDRLAPHAQLMLKVASVVGRAFRRSTVAEIFPVARERDRVPELLDELTRLDLTVRETEDDDPSYVFRHALTRDVSYDLMLLEQRRGIHEKIADFYERTPESELHTVVAALAHHREFALAGLEAPEAARVTQAATALVRAGRHALDAGATPEAIRLTERALGWLDALPASRERSRLELEARCLLGAAYTIVHDPLAPVVRAQLERARVLCVEVGEVERLFESVFGLWYAEFNAADRRGSVTYANELLAIAPGSPLAQQAAGATALADGDHWRALRHLDAALATREAPTTQASALSRARDPVVLTHCFRAWSHVYLGDLDRARDDAATAVELARAVPHPLTMTQALCYAALVRRYRNEPEAAAPLVARSLALSEEHGFPYWNVVATSVVGWLSIARGDVERGIEELRAGIARGRAAGLIPIVSIVMLADILDGLLQLGHLDDARVVLDEAIAMRDTQLVGFHAAEIHRLEGVAWHAFGDPARAIDAIERAIAIARSQDAKLLEHRAAMSLAVVRRLG